MRCKECNKTDGLVYTSYPPKVRCRLTGNFHFMNDKCDAVNVIKHGHWELSPFDGNWMCSKCGNKPYHDNMKNMNYCPNCGAKMDEEANGNN